MYLKKYLRQIVNTTFFINKIINTQIYGFFIYHNFLKIKYH